MRDPLHSAAGRGPKRSSRPSRRGGNRTHSDQRVMLASIQRTLAGGCGEDGNRTHPIERARPDRPLGTCPPTGAPCGHRCACRHRCALWTQVRPVDTDGVTETRTRRADRARISRTLYPPRDRAHGGLEERRRSESNRQQRGLQPCRPAWARRRWRVDPVGIEPTSTSTPGRFAPLVHAGPCARLSEPSRLALQRRPRGMKLCIRASQRPPPGSRQRGSNPHHRDGNPALYP